jgi:hypothetical protein
MCGLIEVVRELECEVAARREGTRAFGTGTI